MLTRNEKSRALARLQYHLPLTVDYSPLAKKANHHHRQMS